MSRSRTVLLPVPAVRTAALGGRVAAVAYLCWVDWRLAAVMLLPAAVGTVVVRRRLAAHREGMRQTRPALMELDRYARELAQAPPAPAGAAHDRYTAARAEFGGRFATGIGRIGPLTATTEVIFAPVTTLCLTLVAGSALAAAGALRPLDLVPFLLLAGVVAGAVPAAAQLAGGR
nr:putative ATP-binding ABC transporter [uncultured bacterium]